MAQEQQNQQSAQPIRQNSQDAAPAENHVLPTDQQVTRAWRSLANDYNNRPRLAQIIARQEVNLERDEHDIILECHVQTKEQQKWIQEKVFKELEDKLRQRLGYDRIMLEISVNQAAAQVDDAPGTAAPAAAAQRKEQQSNLWKWINALPHSKINPLFRELKKEEYNHFFSAPYGTDSINAIRTLSYPQDEALIQLSVMLRRAVRNGELSLAQTIEPGYDVKAVIRSNASLCERYEIMHHVASKLAATYSKAPLEINIPIDGKDGKGLIKTLSVIRKPETEDIVMTATMERNVLFVKTEKTLKVTPDTFDNDQWYQIAALAERHYREKALKAIDSTLDKQSERVVKSIVDMKKDIKDAIRTILLEVASTTLMDGFKTKIVDGHYFSDFSIEHSEVFVVINDVAKRTQERTGIDSIETAELPDTFNALVEHVRQKIKETQQ